MSEKITGKDLEKLIESVLSERAEIDATGSKQKNLYYTKSGEPIVGNWQELVGANSFPKGDANSDNKIKAKTIKQVDALSNKSTSPKDTLSIEDIKKVIEDNISYFLEPEKKIRISPSLGALLKIIEGGNKSKKEEVQKAISDVVKKRFSAEKEPLVTRKIINSLGMGSEDDVGGLAYPSLPKKSLETTQAKFRKADSKTFSSPSLVSLFSAIDGESIAEKMDSIGEFSKKANEKTLSEWAQDRDEFAPYAYSRALTMLSEEIKGKSAESAGYSFERWLALVLNMPVAGASNGAADNLAKVVGAGGDGTVQFSAKLNKNLFGEYAPSQSLKEIEKDIVNGPIFYIIGRKIGSKERSPLGLNRIHAADIFLVKVEKAEDGFKGSIINTEGKALGPLSLPIKGDRLVVFPQINAKATKLLGDLAFTTIYLPGETITEEGLLTTGDFLANQLKDLEEKPITKAVFDVARRMKNMRDNTDSYVGKSKHKKGSATDYIRKISTDYMSLDGLYKDIFSYGGDEGKQLSSPLDESKKITAKMLQKIIEENFNK